MSFAPDTSLDRDGAEDTLSQLRRRVLEGQSAEAYDLLEKLLVSGWDVERIITNFLAVIQRQMGEAWQTGRLTVTDVHIATAVVDELLGALGREVAAPDSPGTVALVCATGEWHVTPARMAAILLRHHGWRATFLGGSTPGEDLAHHLEATRPDVLAVSCTDPQFLLGAANAADIARRLGIPTIAGGRAFGDRAKRADQLGFDGWAGTVADAAALIDSWMDTPPSLFPPPEIAFTEQRDLTRCWSSITDQAIQRLSNVRPPVLHHREQPLEAVRQDLVDLLRAARLADLCDDPSVFEDFVTWRRAVVASPGVPSAAVPATIEVLGDLTAPLGGRTQTLLRSMAGATTR